MISEFWFIPFADKRASSVTPSRREMPKSVSPLCTLYVSPVVATGVVGTVASVGRGVSGGGGGSGGDVGRTVGGASVVGAVLGTKSVVAVVAGCELDEEESTEIAEIAGGLS